VHFIRKYRLDPHPGRRAKCTPTPDPASNCDPQQIINANLIGEQPGTVIQVVHSEIRTARLHSSLVHITLLHD